MFVVHSCAGDLDSVLSVSTCAPIYGTQSSQDSNPSSSYLVSSSVPSTARQTLLDSSVSRTDPTIDQESNPPTIPDQPSEPAESDTSHIEEDVMSPVTNANMPEVRDVPRLERLLTGDGGSDSKDESEECDTQHEEEDVAGLS